MVKRLLKNRRGLTLVELTLANMIFAIGIVTLTTGFVNLRKIQMRLEKKMEIQITLNQIALHLANVMKVAEKCGSYHQPNQSDCIVQDHDGTKHEFSYRFERDLQDSTGGTLTLLRDGRITQSIYLARDILAYETLEIGVNVKSGKGERAEYWKGERAVPQLTLSKRAPWGDLIKTTLPVTPRLLIATGDGRREDDPFKWRPPQPAQYRWSPVGGR